MPTPARKQYLDIKAHYPDALLMYQVGDFFEFFDDDARAAANALQIVLTSRAYGPSERVPLAGVPLHALDTYAGRLVAQGFKVAICEQMEPPGRGLVRREVTRVLSPGTVVDPGLLPLLRDNYLVAIAYTGRPGSRVAGLAFVEASTGTFACTQWQPNALPDALQAEIHRLRPAEILMAVCKPNTTHETERSWAEGYQVTDCPPHYFERDSARLRLCRHFHTSSLAAFGCEGLPAATIAAGAILAYLERMNPALLGLITNLRTYQTSEYLQVDSRTWAALEVIEPARGGFVGATLLKTLDGTRTAMGARLLRRTIMQPLADKNALEARLDSVAALHDDIVARQALAITLDGTADLERLASRIVQGIAQPRELYALTSCLERVSSVREALSPHPAGNIPHVVDTLDPCREVVQLIHAALAPPDTDGGRILRQGYSAELDVLINSVAASRRWIAGLETAERERTGIKSLHVTYNKVFGYSIEVSKSQLARVPAEYVRKQTIATGERFVTVELKEHEALVTQAEDRIAVLEKRLYADLLSHLAQYYPALRQTAEAIARADVWLALAEVAAVRGYCRPILTDDLTLDVRAGRHPVVETALDGGEFIPNDTTLCRADEDTDGQDSRVLLLTGPNMAGKSTYLRQVAQCVLLAQIGSFVPARACRVGVVDRLFLRVGADDDLARGVSTFMREMTETAYILRHATERSLVVFDEVGRGTSARDGLALARAIVEYVHDRIGARTLFATHFHELADLADHLPRLQLAAMEVAERDGRVVFSHRLVQGRSHHSYGIHVARMAGLPATVTSRAATLLAEAAMPTPYAPAGALSASFAPPDVELPARVQEDSASIDSLLDCPHDAARDLALGVASLNVAAMTPMEAINILFSLQQRAAAAVRSRRI